jgi:hypothetical protein
VSTYNHLPVYKTTYDLFLEIFKITRNFRREYKYTIGQRLKDEVLDLMTNIYRANTKQRKSRTIQKARENIEVIRLLIRALKDLKEISVKNFTNINIYIESVSKQLTKWQQSSEWNNF